MLLQERNRTLRKSQGLHAIILLINSTGSWKTVEQYFAIAKEIISNSEFYFHLNYQSSMNEYRLNIFSDR